MQQNLDADPSLSSVTATKSSIASQNKLPYPIDLVVTLVAASRRVSDFSTSLLWFGFRYSEPGTGSCMDRDWDGVRLGVQYCVKVMLCYGLL